MSNLQATPNSEFVNKVQSIVDNNKNITLQELQTQLAAKQESDSSDDDYTTELLDVGQFTCKVGLNVVLGALIATAIAAGVVVGPEAAVVAAIVRFVGGRVAAATIAKIINGAIAGGGAASVEEIISEICSKV